MKEIAAAFSEYGVTTSATSLSAWRKGYRDPAIKSVKTLRQVVNCGCPAFGNEAINRSYGQTAMAPGQPTHKRPAPARERRDSPPSSGRRTQKFFVGRDDELRRFADLQAGRDTRRVINIYGPGGIGKTAVFQKFVALGHEQGALLGHADVADIMAIGTVGNHQGAELLRALVSTLERTELDPLRRDLLDLELAANAVRGAGGVNRLYGTNGRPVSSDSLPQANQGASPRLLRILANRIECERYLRQVEKALIRTFCEGLNAIVAADGSKTTLLLDTYEESRELDDWICGQVVPALPEHTRMVILGRRQLTKTNVDWADHEWCMSVRSLPELSEDEAKTYLRHYGLTDPQMFQGVYAVTRGYPLLLFLARVLSTESGGWEQIGELEEQRDRYAIADGLLSRILREERVRKIRDVLESCSIAPWINPDIIAALLDVKPGAARDLYQELSTHSFVTRHPHGVSLHDKIRELLQEYLKFASASRYNDLTKRLAAHFGHKGGVADVRG
ncbi:ATP-binding protein [Streptomyces sp. MMBL 11-3]|uniref:ATP-binding protein n=1 Tax=Streptomyces sp. MMBL 11-3 TaxID=3382639 RepID=UPI0039B4D159